MNDFFYDSWRIIVGAVVLGVVFGAVYDVFRIVRIARRSPDVPLGTFYEKIRPQKKLFSPSGRFKKTLDAADSAVVFAEDILFFLICAAATVLFFLGENDGEVRIYCIIFSVIGFFAYRISFGRVVIFLSSKIIFLIKCLIYWTIYIIILPIRRIMALARKATKLIFGATVGKAFLIIRKKRSKKLKAELFAAADTGFGIFEESKNVEEE